MDIATQKLLEQWRATLTEKEKRLYELARVKLKKTLHSDDATDNGSFFPEYCHGFQAWKKSQGK